MRDAKRAQVDFPATTQLQAPLQKFGDSPAAPRGVPHLCYSPSPPGTHPPTTPKPLRQGTLYQNTVNRENAIRIAATLPPEAKVLDVGGSNAPFPPATHILDFLPYEERNREQGKLLHDVLPVKFTKDTWCQRDVCDHKPWPYPDQFFDYCVCSHLLEDVRDPIWVCSEINRVARAGYLETPSRVLEQTLGIENPRHAGFYHHRWLVTMLPQGVIQFRHKPHTLHGLNAAIVTRVGAFTKLNPVHEIQWMEWPGSLHASEVVILDEVESDRELCRFAAQARSLSDLKVPTNGPLIGRLKRAWYYRRLARGER